MLERFAADCNQIEIFDFRYQGYYQSETSNCLSRHAIQKGADWVFFLDADEFIDVDDRERLESLVKTLSHEVMLLPWMNLVPTDPGSFTEFDAGQAFRWDGRLSGYGKIAMSATFAARYPDYVIHQGNHAVSPSRAEPAATTRKGCPLMHVPIRSPSRLRFKLSAGLHAYEAMAGRNPADGYHWFELHDRLERETATADWINGVIARYGEPLDDIPPVNTSGEEWTLKFILRAARSNLISAAESLATTTHADAQLLWTETVTVDGAILRAHIRNQDIILQPIRSNDGE